MHADELDPDVWDPLSCRVKCMSCSPETRREMFCPDLGLRDRASEDERRIQLGAGPLRGRRRGVVFDRCPAYFLRSPREYPGRARGVGGQSLFVWVASRRHDLDAGAMGPAGALPARLSALISILKGEEARRARAVERAIQLEQDAAAAAQAMRE